jgi:hypothetical protein
MATMNDIRAAYQEAHGHWSVFNWLTHYGSLDLDGLSSRKAHQAAHRWRAVATDAVAGDEMMHGEEASLAHMALHLWLRGPVVCRNWSPKGRLKVCGHPARRFCAEALAREWKFAASWLAEIESDARRAEDAREAVRAAEVGDWELALDHARQAYSIESGYDDLRPWERLGAGSRASGEVALSP